jgi:predicted DNA-binding WGR domain protein
MSCCGARPSAEPHPNASRFERGSAPHQEFWEVHLEGCTVCQRWSTLALEYEFARLTAPKQQRAKRSERPRCSRKTHKTEAAAEAERAKLIATKRGLGFVEKPKEIPCAPPPRID